MLDKFCLWLHPIFAAYNTILHCHVYVRALEIDYDDEGSSNTSDSERWQIQQANIQGDNARKFHWRPSCEDLLEDIVRTILSFASEWPQTIHLQ